MFLVLQGMLTQKAMKVRIDETLLNSINVMNTLNGGVIEPLVKLAQYPEYRQIRARVPGFEPERLKVEIRNNFLMVFYTHTFDLAGETVTVPRFVYHKAIPYFIDSQKIYATIEEDELVVKLPFNGLANGYHRSISVNQE
jgi:HSP20 family molecular chaperone IbpA